MTLEEICDAIAEVVQDLMYGDISVSHKADILDDILAVIGWDVAEGIEPPLENVKETLAGLEDFQLTYNVDLKKPIRNLKKYVSNKEKEE